MKFSDRSYKRHFYISCRHVIKVDLINVISGFRSDLECDRRRGTWMKRNSEWACSQIEGERKEGWRNIKSAKMEWVVNETAV